MCPVQDPLPISPIPPFRTLSTGLFLHIFQGTKVLQIKSSILGTNIIDPSEMPSGLVNHAGCSTPSFHHQSETNHRYYTASQY